MGTHEQLLEACKVYREIYESQYKKQQEASMKEPMKRMSI